MKLLVTSILCFMLLACSKKENQPQMPTATQNKEYNDYLWFEVPTKSLQLGESYLLAHSEPRSYYDNSKGSYYYFDTTTSSVTFNRFDSTIVSGKFKFNGINANNDTIHIIEGSFDISRQ